MKITALVVASAAVASVLAQTTTGQSTSTMDGWAAGSAYNMLYNASSEVTFNGRVTGVVATQAPAQGMTPVVTALVRSPNGGTSAVDLGPDWYISHLGRPVGVGDEVAVTGSKVYLNGRTFIIARKVVRGNRVLYLREASGFPMWIASRGHVDVTSNTPRTPGTVTTEPTDLITNRVVVSNPPPDNGTTTNQQTAVKTINGSVNKITTLTNPQTGQVDTVVLVNTPNGVVSVDLGPQWYMQQQNLALPNGTDVAVQAAPPVFQLPNSATPIYVANGLSYGNNVMVFRNSLGFPVWAPFGGR